MRKAQRINQHRTKFMIIKLNIDVTKLDKKRFHKGAKGTYANLTVLLKDSPDQYGNDGMIVEDVSQEERQAGTKGAIVGNARIAGQKPKAQSAPAPSSAADDDSDIPF
jgi:hypothetical protein